MPSGLKVSGLQKGRFMIDRKAFRSLSSGLYLITAKAGDARCGCVVNTLVQVASEPATLSVSLNKENATTAAILESGRFAATVLAEDDPAARIERLFAKEPEFLPVYKRILLMADTEEGTGMGLMSVAVDTDPAIAENRRFYVQHFVESLERAGAFVWADGAWHATDAGRAALAGALAKVVDDYEVPAVDDVTCANVPTLTDGVNW